VAGAGDKLNLFFGRTWAAAFLCLSALPVIAAETVQSLRYGASLYHYYQRDYFGAITELTAAQALDALGPHADNADLLLGGMVLSYGMDRQAESIFLNELQKPRDSVDADRAWFYLGKLAWQRGDAPRAADTLANMAPGYSGAVREEANYLRASTALALADVTAAESYLSALADDSRWRSYLNYNLGASYAAQGDWNRATSYFTSITQDTPESAEAWALYDRTLTAAGYAWLADGALEESGAAFRQVRLDGPYANRALLGYGWSAAGRGEYLQALSPWQQLAGRSLLDESARESLLAVPYAYTQLGRPGLALRNYRHASERYTEELAELDRAVEAFRERPLGPLLGISEEADADWLFDVGILPEGEHSPYLQHLVSRHRFQVALRELRDLYHIAAHLERAQQRLQVLQHVDAHQRQVWAVLVEQDRRNRMAARHEALAREQQASRLRLQAAIDQPDGRLLADREQTGRWQRLERAAGLAAAIGAPQGATRDRLRLLRGLLIWHDSEHYPGRAWQARRELDELDALAGETVTALERVDAAIESRRQSDFAPRITALDQQVGRQAGQVAETIARSESALREIAIAELERQGEQLLRALGQSKLAIAQLHDHAMRDGAHE
jgi:TolA-binding protein